MDDQSGRILSLEASLADVQRSLTAHDLLLRAVLTHLALSEPDAFRNLISGFARSGLYGFDPLKGEMTREVSAILTEMFEEVASSVKNHRQA